MLQLVAPIFVRNAEWPVFVAYSTFEEITSSKGALFLDFAQSSSVEAALVENSFKQTSAYLSGANAVVIRKQTDSLVPTAKLTFDTVYCGSILL